MRTRRAGVLVAMLLLACDTLPGARLPEIPAGWEVIDPGDPGPGDPGTRDLPDDGRRDLPRDADGGQEVPGDAGGCVRQCYGQVCGPDGCGGVCGVCPPETACSHDGTLCILRSRQAPLGGACGPTMQCGPLLTDPWAWGLGLTNPDYPACLDDQCRDGPCLPGGACSRSCRTTRDLVQNGTGLPFPDGIDDGDAPPGDCQGALEGVFPGGTWACVEAGASASSPEGRCLPRSSFTPCHDGTPCPAGEACGFVKVRGNLEARCLAVPAGAQGVGGPCGWDDTTRTATRCESWACTQEGCTLPCVDDRSCRTEGARCQEGRCDGSSRTCETDGDCSAWTCQTGVVVRDLLGSFVACGPRPCQVDADCRDQGYYCLHDPVRMIQGLPGDPIGRCVRRTAGGADLGESCNEASGDGLPDRPCANREYCLDERCSALCTSDQDCSSGQRCVVREYTLALSQGLEADFPLPVPLCGTLGEAGGAPCGTDGDCGEGACAPYVLVDHPTEVAWVCREKEASDQGPGAPCGSGQSPCAGVLCLDEDVANQVPGFCTAPCFRNEDCPVEGFWRDRRLRFLCESRVVHRMGSWYAGDDLRASVCVAVSGDSSLEPCDFSSGSCLDPREFCRPTVVFGPPAARPVLGGFCVRPEAGAGMPGTPCDPNRNGKDCATGFCERSIYPQAGFCTHACQGDQDCWTLAAWGATCAPRVVVSADPVSWTIPLCRQAVPCVACTRDEDCSPGLRCLDAAQSPYEQDLRCVPACEDDRDCAGMGDGVTCQEARAPLISSPSGLEKGCLPLACP
ncbi:MAG TPA: hypothetical protein PLQ97_01255 [Myxococcota bacterium]|nr:hypothetical protein [Myxococcota bacterium]HQK49801.1 hypothetical protein [Myxococcota bacterium]